MAPKLKVDKVSPPPARLSAFLYHTPTVWPSLILFLGTTLLLVLAVHSNLRISSDGADIVFHVNSQYFTFVALLSFSIPVISISYLVSHISWL